MDTQLLRLRVKQIVSELANDMPIEQIENEHRLAEYFGMDSLDRIQIVMSLEDEFGILIPDADQERLTLPTATVCDLINQVELQTSTKASNHAS